MEKCSTTEQATDDNVAHALCMLDNEGYRNTPRICITYCFFLATVVMRTRLNLTLGYVLHASYQHARSGNWHFCVLRDSDQLVTKWRH